MRPRLVRAVTLQTSDKLESVYSHAVLLGTPTLPCIIPAYVLNGKVALCLMNPKHSGPIMSAPRAL